MKKRFSPRCSLIWTLVTSCLVITKNSCYNLKLMSQNNGELNCQVNKNAQLSCKRTMTIFLQTVLTSLCFLLSLEWIVCVIHGALWGSIPPSVARFTHLAFFPLPICINLLAAQFTPNKYWRIFPCFMKTHQSSERRINILKDSKICQ